MERAGPVLAKSLSRWLLGHLPAGAHSPVLCAGPAVGRLGWEQPPAMAAVWRSHSSSVPVSGDLLVGPIVRDLARRNGVALPGPPPEAERWYLPLLTPLLDFQQAGLTKAKLVCGPRIRSRAQQPAEPSTTSAIEYFAPVYRAPWRPREQVCQHALGRDAAVL